MSEPVKFTPPFKQLVDGVSKYLAEHNVSAVVERGITDAHRKPVAGRTNRIIFYGSNADGSAGSIVGPREPGQVYIGGDDTTDPPTPPSYAIRALSDWVRSLRVSIWAYDVDRQNDEGAQDDAAWQLWRWLKCAVQSVALGNHEWGNPKIVIPTDRAFGLEIVVGLTFRSSFYDVPAEIGTPSPAITKGALP